MEGGQTMRAIVVHDVGGAEKLLYEETPVPTPGHRDLLVEVAAAGLNYIDTYHRGGLYPLSTPFTPGLEGAGTVIDVGADVSRFSPGDRVVWTVVLGSYAEKHVVPEDKALDVPEGVSSKDAAAVILQGITAQYLVTSTYLVESGDICLIHAGAGGVGLLLTQMVKELDGVVITTVGAEAKAGLSREAGADTVINYKSTDFAEEVVSQYGERPLAVVYDGVGASTFHRGLELLRPRGTMVTFGNASGAPDPVSPLDLMRHGSLYVTRPTLMDYTATPAELAWRAGDVLSRVESGRLSVRIGAEFPLADAEAAHIALEARQTTGKVLLIP